MWHPFVVMSYTEFVKHNQFSNTNGLEMLCQNDFGPSSIRLFVPSVVRALLVRSDVVQEACPGLTRHQAGIHPGWDPSASSIRAELVVKYYWYIQSS